MRKLPIDQTATGKRKLLSELLAGRRNINDLQPQGEQVVFMEDMQQPGVYVDISFTHGAVSEQEAEQIAKRYKESVIIKFVIPDNE